MFLRSQMKWGLKIEPWFSYQLHDQMFDKSQGKDFKDKLFWLQLSLALHVPVTQAVKMDHYFYFINYIARLHEYEIIAT